MRCDVCNSWCVFCFGEAVSARLFDYNHVVLCSTQLEANYLAHDHHKTRFLASTKHPHGNYNTAVRTQAMSLLSHNGVPPHSSPRPPLQTSGPTPPSASNHSVMPASECAVDRARHARTRAVVPWPGSVWFAAGKPRSHVLTSS